MSTKPFLILALAVANLALPSAADARRIVDLDVPGTIEALQRDDPGRYGVVAALLDDASRLAPAAARGALHAKYDADDVRLEPLLLVSFPAQRRLSFGLADTTYRATVVVREPVARPVPVR